MSTPFHAKYLAHELTKRLPAEKAEKLSQSLANATVDLNPHQIEAALFAFRSPLSRGAILADEVGLGKTIEAGLIVSQLWAERKRRILCVVPASLRKQWNRELAEKFYIGSTILESKAYNQAKKNGVANPFLVENKVVIVSYQFASAKADELRPIAWDLVVIDEAHRVRNVYKKSNKIARSLRDSIGTRPKVLLTATPLQNTLMELYGLVSFIDPHIFGNEDSFREQFARQAGEIGTSQYQALKNRIRPVCQRTLRRQVTAYVPYTKRFSITQDFTPTAAEQALYEQVSAYLQKPDLFALPSGQRQLITLVLRKILASSSFAIGDTLGTMITRLEGLRGVPAATPDEHIADVVGPDIDHADELEEEWPDENEVASPPPPPLTPEKEAAIAAEIEELKSYRALAGSIQTNAKGQALLAALNAGFAKAVEFGAPPKALVFTESRRTQLYLLQLLEAAGYAGQIVLFNGSNSDPASKATYKRWLARHVGHDVISGSPSADMRSALVDEFRDIASIMIATESAAEGVNLQFCNLVVNYDLPWNPQRIEQRIGRCHRYGQKHDVVVVNFLNRSNHADERVFQLLRDKFQLFDGVFGASDEVLGVLESGVDFEKRINGIYQTCRTPDEINAAFDKLQHELEAEIDVALTDARSKLLENFDDEVHKKLKLREQETRQQLNQFGQWLWELTKVELADFAQFDGDTLGFRLTKSPAGIPAEIAPLGSYQLPTGINIDTDVHFRVGHPLAEAIIEQAKTRTLSSVEVTFDYASCNVKLSLVENLCGRSGWLRLTRLAVTALETEDHLVFGGTADDGESIDSETLTKLMIVPASVGVAAIIDPGAATKIDEQLSIERTRVLGEAMDRNQRYFDAQMAKLDLWAEDLKENLESQIKGLSQELTAAKREALQAPDLAAKLELQKKAREIERQRNAKRKSLFEAQDAIDAEKDKLLADTGERLKQQLSEEEVFTLRWRVT